MRPTMRNYQQASVLRQYEYPLAAHQSQATGNSVILDAAVVGGSPYQVTTQPLAPELNAELADPGL